MTAATTSDVSSLKLFDGVFELTGWSIQGADSTFEKVALWSASVANISCPFFRACVNVLMLFFTAVAYAARVHFS